MCLLRVVAVEQLDLAAKALERRVAQEQADAEAGRRLLTIGLGGEERLAEALPGLGVQPRTAVEDLDAQLAGVQQAAKRSVSSLAP